MLNKLLQELFFSVQLILAFVLRLHYTFPLFVAVLRRDEWVESFTGLFRLRTRTCQNEGKFYSTVELQMNRGHTRIQTVAHFGPVSSLKEAQQKASAALVHIARFEMFKPQI
ncbi:hypothetical protein ORE12_002223 [Salmonella enterica subsp. enterica serovar Newport]|nr:hypothetical protein [Salmonella enterica subsp. enterica serovar Stanley]EAS1640360.1 hypothetical protein [Salmonella enterica]EBS4494552.1 hypothetical protein [Salmonella enterica subsp. enterica serovar Agona]EBV0925416.1 hypothetical protein [Salmonella enterica subsp. enterica serovar Newport]EBV2761952.1 hypothetical protein [Salmonella enterica subsp. enterica serovar Weltevreden]EDL4196900.1 hypothetical protein [Salmonella enterica subsp. enterica serovar Infantis]EDT1787857.1 h